MVTIKDGNKIHYYLKLPQTWNPQNDHYEAEEKNEFKEFKEIMLGYWDRNLTTVFSKKRDIQIADRNIRIIS